MCRSECYCYRSRIPRAGAQYAVYPMCVYREYLSQHDRGIRAQSHARFPLTDPGELCGDRGPPAGDASRCTRLFGATGDGSLPLPTAEDVRVALARHGSRYHHVYGSSSLSLRHLSVSRAAVSCGMPWTIRAAMRDLGGDYHLGNRPRGGSTLCVACDGVHLGIYAVSATESRDLSEGRAG